MSKLLAQVDIQEQLFKNQPYVVDNGFSTSITTFISSILPNIYVLAGIILLAYLVFGGFMYITAAGNNEQMQKGQQALTNAIIGFLIIFASYWIIQIIQVITGIPILNANL
jgi:hypothetical protein